MCLNLTTPSDKTIISSTRHLLTNGPHCIIHNGGEKVNAIWRCWYVKTPTNEHRSPSSDWTRAGVASLSLSLSLFSLSPPPSHSPTLSQLFTMLHSLVLNVRVALKSHAFSPPSNDLLNASHFSCSCLHLLLKFLPNTTQKSFKKRVISTKNLIFYAPLTVVHQRIGLV